MRQNAGQPLKRDRWTIYTSTAPRPANDERKSEDSGKADSIQSLVQRSDQFCSLNVADRSRYVAALRNRALGGASRHILRRELLLSVSQYNIIAAMTSNAAALGLTMESLREDIPSPFNLVGAQPKALPPALQPTTTQRAVPHHPWIDLCPSPSIRDAMLQLQGSYSEDELCHDLFGAGQGTAGLLVWGEPWDPEAYEVSEYVLRKYGRLFQGCHDLLRSTNRWRKTRGETLLREEDVGGSRVTELE